MIKRSVTYERKRYVIVPVRFTALFNRVSTQSLRMNSQASLPFLSSLFDLIKAVQRVDNEKAVESFDLKTRTSMKDT